jgi:hypothetical protein
LSSSGGKDVVVVVVVVTTVVCVAGAYLSCPNAVYCCTFEPRRPSAMLLVGAIVSECSVSGDGGASVAECEVPGE